jgi:hypothetical protein
MLQALFAPDKNEVEMSEIATRLASKKSHFYDPLEQELIGRGWTATAWACSAKIGPAVGIGLTIVLYLLQIPFSHWWMKWFQYGPAEWLWRSLTYLTHVTQQTIRGCVRQSPSPPGRRPGGEGDQGGEGSEKANRVKAEHPDGRVQTPPRKVTA